MTQEQSSFQFNEEELAELNHYPNQYPNTDFTIQSMIAKEEKHFLWLDEKKIKKKFMEKMSDPRSV